MNERIKELLNELNAFGYDDDGNEYTPMLVGSKIEKFAELIVKECAKIADDNYSLGIPTGQIMKQYFGVEE